MIGKKRKWRKMKDWICSNCHNQKQEPDNIICIQCSCGYPMEELLIIKSGDKESDEERNNN